MDDLTRGECVVRIKGLLFLILFCAFGAQAPAAASQWFDPIDDIYWTPPDTAARDIFSEDGKYQYEEQFLPDTDSAIESMPENVVAGTPKIAIIIDDMGIDEKRSARAIGLHPAVTLAYLPYAPRVQAQVDAAIAAGHEVIVHMPMQPTSDAADPGTNVLRSDLPPLELMERIEKNLDAFKGYAGVNNHMGSAFTSDAEALDILMAELDARNLFFVDSKTAPQSRAEERACASGIPTTHRDVFLDHIPSPENVEAQMQRAESIARRYGQVVVIGHPKDVTLDILETWFQKQTEKGGLNFVPVSDLVKKCTAKTLVSQGDSSAR